ncbi:MAG: hypothetical protein PHE70_05470, partial [Tepidanaerobacteraceae bacterium]|nr:hypothetical protein [Tepidanaerobacteraceae bacterium]
MSKLLKLFMVLIAVAVFSIFALDVKAGIAEPGSDSDPLVTKSYVDKVVLNMKQYVDAMSGGSMSFEIVYIEKDQRIIGDKGSEIILRSGIATVVDSGNGGLADITAGKDTIDGENVIQNHLLIVPRDDGRGVKAETDNVVLLVRGGYT